MSDRVFAIHCNFPQEEFNVATNLQLSPALNPTYNLSGTSLIPNIELKIVTGRAPDPDLAAARQISIGEPLIFGLDFLEIYGIQVGDCYAETLHGMRLKILSNGCTTDMIVVSDVQYMEKAQKAFADSMGFKFPDAEDVWIFCEARLCIQRQLHLKIQTPDAENDLCPVELNPDCKQQAKLNLKSNYRYGRSSEKLPYTLITANIKIVDNADINSTNSGTFLIPNLNPFKLFKMTIFKRIIIHSQWSIA